MLSVKNITITAAIIVKNEESHINNCLKSLIDAVDKILIIDTGCTDNTIEIAKPFSKVIDFEWCDDFSAARNAAIPHLKSDWVIWINGDEYLYEEEIKNLKIAAAIYDSINVPVLLRIRHMNESPDGQVIASYDINRMYSLKYPYKFYSKIHEQLQLEGIAMYEHRLFSKSVRVKVYHNSYTSSKIEHKDKFRRNLHLLKIMMKEDSDNPSLDYFFMVENFVMLEK